MRIRITTVMLLSVVFFFIISTQLVAGPIAFSPKNPSVGDTIIFKNMDTSTPCIAWHFGDGKKQNVKNSSRTNHSYDRPGTFIVKAWDRLCDDSTIPTAIVNVTVRSKIKKDSAASSDSRSKRVVRRPGETKGKGNKDGSRSWNYENGSKTVITKSGKLTHYDGNGRIVYTLWHDDGDTYYSIDKGGGHTFFDIKNGKKLSKHLTVYQDRSVIYYDTNSPDGEVTGYSTEKCDPYIKGGGSISTKHDNGSITTYKKDGWRDYSKHADDTTTYYAPPDKNNHTPVAYTQDKVGEKTYRQVAGMVVDMPDGSTQSCHVVTYERDGSVSCWTMGFKVLTIHPDLSVSYYDLHGRKKNTEPKEKSRTNNSHFKITQEKKAK